MTDVGVRGSEKQRVAFLLLDGVELDTIEFFRKERILPNLDRLLSDGKFRALASRDTYSAEATPTEMITGRTAEETKYWSLLEFNPETYRCRNVGAHRGLAFYDRPDLRSIVFDVPHMRIDPSTPGIQVAAWGCHSAQFPRSSNPPHLIVDIEAEFGTQHTPEFEDIHASHNLEWGRAVTDHITESLVKRPKIVERLMELEPDWDLLFVGSTESHMHEHAFHHSVDPSHALYDHPATPDTLVFMRELFISIDKMVGEIEALLPEGTPFVIGSAHGSKASAADSSSVLAAELVYRAETGRKLIDLPLHMESPVELESWQRARGYMQRYKLSPGKPQHPGAREAAMHYIQWACHRYAPGKPERWLEKASRKIKGQSPEWWIVKKYDPLTEPVDISGDLPTEEILSEPANWYSHAWPEMRYFAVPSFSGLHIRINLEGREKHGIVKLEDYDAVCTEVEEMLSQLTDGQSGSPILERSARMRIEDPMDPNGASADIALVLQAATTVRHPDFGLIGTIPFGRVGEHSERGWLAVNGEGVEESAQGTGAPVDIGPTLLELMGFGPTERCSGRPVFTSADSLVRP